MPPKAKFTKNEIVKAALKIVEREGIDYLTARSLGNELKSSARPIFTVFSGMSEVYKAVIEEANAVYGEYVEEGLKEELPFKGVGTKYIKFADKRPKLFQLLFMKEREEYTDKFNVLQGIEKHYDKIMNSIEENYGLNKKNSENLYLHLWIYTHGIAVLTATKVCIFTESQISNMLTEVFLSLLRNLKSELKND